MLDRGEEVGRGLRTRCTTSSAALARPGCAASASAKDASSPATIVRIASRSRDRAGMRTLMIARSSLRPRSSSLPSRRSPRERLMNLTPKVHRRSGRSIHLASASPSSNTRCKHTVLVVFGAAFAAAYVSFKYTVLPMFAGSARREGRPARELGRRELDVDLATADRGLMDKAIAGDRRATRTSRPSSCAMQVVGHSRRGRCTGVAVRRSSYLSYELDRRISDVGAGRARRHDARLC